MDRYQATIDRRTYLKTIGATGTVAVTGLAGCLGGNGDATSLTAGTAPGFPPFEMKEGGELVGFDIDLLEAVVDETEYTLTGWEEFEFDSLIPALTNENIDVIAAALTINDERDETIDFSDPYYSADQAILVADDSGFEPGSLEDLADRTVGAQSGTTGEGVVEDQLIANDLITEGQYNSYGNYVLAVEDLVNGNIDAVVLDTPVAQTFAADRPVTTAFVYETGENYGFGIRDGESELQTALNEGLQTVRDSGTYQDITAEWFAE